MNYTLGILLSLFFSAFFSGMEIAFLSANKLRLELDKKQGNFSAKILSIFLRNPSRYIATMLVGNSVSLVVFSLLMAKTLEPVIGYYVQSHVYIVIIQTVISTLLILVTAEFLPKALFMITSNLSLRLFSIPVFIFYLLFYPVTMFINNLSIIVLKLFNVKINKQPNPYVFDMIDLDNFIEVTNPQREKVKNKSDYEIKVFQNALDFSKVKLRDCMVPRTEVVAIDLDSTMDELRDAFIKSGFSKILIYQDNIDNIVGYFSSKELFKSPQSLSSKIIQPEIVPESMNANKLLRILLQKRKSLAVVVDEFGGTAGIVTIEDIIEEIFGEIEDEHDTELYVEKVISQTDFVFSARLKIEYLNTNYNLKFPTCEDYETLAGFILYYLGRIPHYNEKFTIKNYDFKVLKANNHKIELLFVKLNKE